MSLFPSDLPAQDIVRTLRQRVRQIESGHLAPMVAATELGQPTGRVTESSAAIVSSCCEALDRLLPAGGFRRGTLVEWLSNSSGSGAGTLAMLVARQAALEGGAVVVMDRHHWFYPPAAAALGVDLEHVIIVRPDTARDEIWALDQSLRCPGVAAVWSSLGDQLDQRDFRRLQLAAEIGACCCVRRQSAVNRPGRTCNCWSSLGRPRALTRDACMSS